MGKNEKGEQSELLASAESLDAALDKFERLVESVQKAPLTSQKGIARAAATLQEIIDAESGLGQHVGRLVQAISGVRQKQEEQAKAAHARALDLQARTNLLQALMERYAELGVGAGELNVALQALEERRKARTEPDVDRAVATEMEALLGKMGEVAQKAGALADDAAEQEFDDVHRQADSLRQQLLSAKNKMTLLQQRLSVN